MRGSTISVFDSRGLNFNISACRNINEFVCIAANLAENDRFYFVANKAFRLVVRSSFLFAKNNYDWLR